MRVALNLRKRLYFYIWSEQSTFACSVSHLIIYKSTSAWKKLYNKGEGFYYCTRIDRFDTRRIEKLHLSSACKALSPFNKQLRLAQRLATRGSQRHPE